MRGPLVLASNHLSYLDPVVLGLLAPRRMNFMAKEELFKNYFFRLLITQLGAFPLKRERGHRSAYEKALAILRGGGVLILFPEGTRARDGKLGHLRKGAIRIALRAGVPLVPVVIQGTDKILPRVKGTIRLGKIKVQIGKPLAAAKLDKNKDFKRKADEFLSSLNKRMRKLSDELCRG